MAIEPVSTLSTVAIAAGTKAVQRAADNLAKSIGTRISKVAKSTLDRVIVELQIGFNEYLTSSYLKCRYFKTMLNPNEPLEVIKHYVNVDFSYKDKKISDVKLINLLPNFRHTVITGLAGSGKSMFMKYMTVCCFESIHDYTPLFVELRHLNFLSSRDLLTFIRNNCIAHSSRITKEQFDLSLKAGALLLILDGFDELNNEFREETQRNILALGTEFPELTIVVSSRPDQRFGSWASFHVLKVNELTKKQCLALVKNCVMMEV